ncbi:P1 protein [Bean enamovirus 1]|nr:P1 protein [Bean enamovirus 1]
MKLSMSQATTPFLLLAFICWFLFASCGAHPGLSGTSPDVGCSPFLGGTLSSVDPPAYCDAFASMPRDLGSVLQSPSLGEEKTEPSPSNHTGPYQIVSTWTWPSWTCSASKCQLSVYFPTLTAIRQDLDHLLADMDLLSTSRACSDLLAKAPGYILRFAGETIIGIASLIELLLVSWNAWLFSLVLYVLRVIPGKVASFCLIGCIAFWVWPKRTAGLLLQVTAFPLTSIQYWHRIVRGLLSRIFSLIWSILTIWSSLPWLILKKMTKILVMSSRVFSRRPTKKVSTKSLKAKVKMAKAIKKKVGKKSSKGESSEERTIPGVQIKKLQEAPPAGAILHCTDAFGDHVGYAAAIKLDGAQSGLAILQHVWIDSTYIAGPNGKMRLADFTCLYDCPKHDTLILTSDVKGWGSKLGARPRPLTTIDAVRLTRYSLFTERDGKWFVQAAKVVAVGGQGMFRVLSDTAPGDSGLPLFDAKLNVALLHRGIWPNQMHIENRAVAVLPVPGLTCSTSPSYLSGGESYFELDSAYSMVDSVDDGEEILIRTKGKALKTFISNNKVATLSIASLERELQKGPIGLWADIVDEDGERAPKRSGNGANRSTPVKQSQAEKVEESSPPKESREEKATASPSTPRKKHLRRSDMTPEQKSADNRRRRQSAKAKRQATKKPTPQAPAPAITINKVKELVEGAVKAALKVRPRSRRSFGASISGVLGKKSPQGSPKSAPAHSQSIRPLPKASPAGDSINLRPQRTYRAVVTSTPGQKQALKRN